MKYLMSNELENACMTTDSWISRIEDGYLTITIHFIGQSFTFKFVLLSCHQYNKCNSSNNLSEQIKNTWTAWNVERKFIFAVSNNAYNIKNALNILEFKSFGCYAHTLNLIVQNSWKLESSLIEKAMVIVTHFHKSSTENQKLATYQINNGAPQLKKSFTRRSYTLEFYIF